MKNQAAQKTVSLPRIFDCAEYVSKRMPPVVDTWGNGRNWPCAFMFARTPTGRVSKFWASCVFRGCAGIPEKGLAEWRRAEEGRLPKGYSWSRAYSY